MLNRSFWKGRQVFLTGHTGFKGSWLSLWLDALGAEVDGYALDPPTQPNLFEQAQVARALSVPFAEIFAIFSGSKMPSQSAVPRWSFIWRRSRSCAAAMKIRSKLTPPMSWARFIFLKPYGTCSTRARSSTSPATSATRIVSGCGAIGKTSQWAVTILIRTPRVARNSSPLLTVIRSFRPDSSAQHGVALASARAGNAIGGGDWTSDQLIPDLVRAFMAANPA